VLDFAGIIFAVVTNLWAASSVETSLSLMCYSVAALLQLLQLLWMCRDSNSYFKQRNTITVLQRLRGIAVSLMIGLRTETRLVHPFGAKMLANPQVGWTSTASVTLMTPTATLMSALYHPAPFKHLIYLSVLAFLVDCCAFHHHKHILYHAIKAQPLLAKTCSKLNAALAVPMAAMNPNFSICPTHAMYIIPAFVYILVAILIPLQVTYWQEEAAKLYYLKAQSGSRTCPPGLPPALNALKALYFLMWGVVAWALLYLSALLAPPAP
jgi:hypothetical protein